MSRFYYFITKEEVPLKIIAQSKLMDFLLEDITKYVKDAKSYYRYYMCIPYVLSNTDEYEGFSDDVPFRGDIYEYQYFSWSIQELYKLGSFKFINVCEDGTKCDPGYHEDFFSRCTNAEIDFNSFKQNFESKERFNKFERISEDILYIMKH